MRRRLPPAAKAAPTPRRKIRFIPRLEILEDRTLLTVDPVMLTGIPDYEQQGPGPIVGGDAEDSQGDQVIGAINAILASDSNHIFVGSVNGGIWRTDNADAVDESTTLQPRHVRWVSLTDQYPSLSISSLAGGTGGAIYAGIDDTSSFKN